MASSLICPHCGAENPPDSQYCDQCSMPLHVQERRAPVAPPPADFQTASVNPTASVPAAVPTASVPFAPPTASVVPADPGAPPSVPPSGGSPTSVLPVAASLNPAAATVPIPVAPPANRTTRPNGSAGGASIFLILGAIAAVLLFLVAIGSAFLLSANVSPTPTPPP